jgi:hypothetical protein
MSAERASLRDWHRLLKLASQYPRYKAVREMLPACTEQAGRRFVAYVIGRDGTSE